MGLLDEISKLKYKPSAFGDGLMNAGIQMLMASTNQPHPIGLGGALAGAAAGFGEGMNNYTANQQKQDELNNKGNLEAAQAEYYRRKANNPNGDADPYFTYISTPQGLVSFDARTGKIEFITDRDGNKLMKAPDDPMNRGEIKKQESRNTIRDITLGDGRTVPMWGGDTVSVNGPMSYVPPSLKTPIPTDGSPISDSIPPGNVQTSPDGKTTLAFKDPANRDLLLQQSEEAQRLFNQRNRPAPTVPASPFGQTTAGKAADDARGRSEGENDAARLKNAQQANDLLSLMSKPYEGDTIDNWIKGSTGGGLSEAADTVSNFFGRAPSTAKANATLGAISSWLSMLTPRLEGPQSNFDAAGYKKMVGTLDDTSLPVETRLATFEAIKDMLRAVVDVKGSGGGEAQPKAPGPAPGSQSNPLRFDRNGNPI